MCPTVQEGARGLSDSSTVQIEPEPYCAVTKFIIKIMLKQWFVKQSQNWWINPSGQRQAKRIHGRSPKHTTDILSLHKKMVWSTIL